MDDLFDVNVPTETESVVAQKLYLASVTWRILNFKNRFNHSNNWIQSPEFQHCGDSWVLLVSPYRTRKSKDVVNICLSKSGCKYLTANPVVSAKFKLSWNEGQDKTREIDKILFQGMMYGCNPAEVVDINDVMKHGSEYLENGALTIKCDMTVFKEITERCEGRNTPEKKDANTNTSSKDFGTSYLYDCPSTEKGDTAELLANVEGLHHNPRFADVILKLGKREFLAHKVILRTRSKVFEAMFEHDMQENRQSTVNLVDMEVHTVKDMLSYIYSGKMRQLSPEEALGLYVAADRYDLQTLVFNCRKIMLKELSIDNICEIAVVADLHNDQLLMNAVKSLLNKSMKEIFKTEKWKLFAKQNPILSLDFIQSAVLNN